MRAVGQNVSALISEVRYYFNNSGMTLPAEQNHQNSILTIQKKIELAAVYIGSRCTQGYTFKTDVSLQGSKYKTK